MQLGRNVRSLLKSTVCSTQSSFIVTEGCGIRIGDLSKQTNCKQWKIEGWGKLKHYSILFFRFDVFGHLWNFGHLSKQLIEAYRDDEHFLDSFKSQLVDSF